MAHYLYIAKKSNCLKCTMDFHKSLFWICFIIIMKITYSLGSKSDFQIPRINSTLKWTEPIRYFGLAIWNNIPIKIGSIKNVDTTELRKWKSKNCWWRLFKTYVRDLGFINIQGLIQAVFDVGLPILRALIWACRDSILRIEHSVSECFFKITIFPIFYSDVKQI